MFRRNVPKFLPSAEDLARSQLESELSYLRANDSELQWQRRIENAMNGQRAMHQTLMKHNPSLPAFDVRLPNPAFKEEEHREAPPVPKPSKEEEAQNMQRMLQEHELKKQRENELRARGNAGAIQFNAYGVPTAPPPPGTLGAALERVAAETMPRVHALHEESSRQNAITNRHNEERVRSQLESAGNARLEKQRHREETLQREEAARIAREAAARLVPPVQPGHRHRQQPQVPAQAAPQAPTMPAINPALARSLTIQMPGEQAFEGNQVLQMLLGNAGSSDWGPQYVPVRPRMSTTDKILRHFAQNMYHPEQYPEEGDIL